MKYFGTSNYRAVSADAMVPPLDAKGKFILFVAAGISGLYYPDKYRTWTKTGQRWLEQLALDGTFNVLKEFWPDIRHSVLHRD